MQSGNGRRVWVVVSLAVLSGFLCGFDQPTSAADKDGPEKLGPEFAVLQGQWERKFQSPNGDVFRMLKEIRGTRETVTVFQVKDGKEERVARWHVTFTVKKTDHVRIFTYINMTYTEGPFKGRKAAGPFSYVYQIRGNYLVTATGVLNPDKQRPSMDIFRRVKPGV